MKNRKFSQNKKSVKQRQKAFEDLTNRPDKTFKAMLKEVNGK